MTSPRRTPPWLLLLTGALLAALPATAGTSPQNPILFVTQFPIAADFATIGSTFANHFPRISKVGRGGDLYVRYPDGELCNVTRENGFGESGVFQGAGAIAVRDPSVHFDGTRALFSMVIGAPTQQFQVIETYWQIYEVTGLGACATTAVAKVANQPPDYNNVTPIYSPDGRIVFSSDRPRDGRFDLGRTAIPERRDIRGFDSEEQNILGLRQVRVGHPSDRQRRRQVRVMGRSAVECGDRIVVQAENRPRTPAGLEGVDDDSPVVADHALHQPQPPVILEVDIDVGPAVEERP